MTRPDETPRDLLFGLLALQNGLIDQDQLVAAFVAWSRAKGKTLALILVERGAIDEESRALLAGMAAKQLKLHGGDPEKSLAAIPAGPSTRGKLATLGDADLTANIALAGSPPEDDDPYRTVSQVIGTSKGDVQRFRILRPHARGGLGAVYVALDGELNREVALKEILDRHADDPNSRARFLIEAQITGGLEHPGIVPVYGMGHYGDGRPYYAMRFIRGDSLKDAIAGFHSDPSLKSDPGKKSLALRTLLRRFVDVCNAIDYAHGRGVLHRDLKPANVIVGKYGETLVVDWGLAKSMGRSEAASQIDERTLILSSSSGSAETLDGSAIGTPSYMSPEQAVGDLDRHGPRSDVYSLGATLYSLLTGKPPFGGTNIGEVLNDVQKGAFPPPRQVDASIDRALEAVCLKAMARSPEDRHATAKELAEDVERWAAGEPVSAWREPASVRIRRRMRRHRSTVASAAAVLVSAVVALSIGLVAVERERERTAAQRDRVRGALEEIRREKDRADKALIAETRSRRRTREVLDDTTSQVVEKLLSRQGSKLGPDEEAFLQKSLASYQEFAAEPGADEGTRAASARAHDRVGMIHHRMGQPREAEASWRQAVALFAELAAEYPGRVTYRAGLANSRFRAGTVAYEAGRYKEAEPEFRAVLELQRGLVAEDPADLDLVGSMAATLENLGRLLARSGRRPEAEESYRSAEAALRKAVTASNAKADHRSALAGLLATRASFQNDSGGVAEAESAYREAIEIGKRLVAEVPLESKYRSNLGTAFEGLAYTLTGAGRYEAADAAYREALATFRKLAEDFPAVSYHRVRLATGFMRYAISSARAGRHAAAEASFRDSLAIRKQLAADYPSDPGHRYSVAAALTNLGVTFAISNRNAEAEAAYREAIAIDSRLAAEFPDIPEYRSDVGRLSFNLAILLDGDAKENALREGIDLLRPLATRSSGLPEDQFLLANLLKQRGNYLSDARKWAEAEAPLRESAALFQRLVAEAPKVALYREEQAILQLFLAEFLENVGRLPEAEASYRESLALFERLVADVPGNPHFGQEMGAVEGNLASLLADRGEFAPAMDWLAKARPRIDAALKTNPARPSYRESLRYNLLNQARCRAGLGDDAGAIEAAESIDHLGFDPIADVYASAKAYGRSIPPAGRDDPYRLADRAIAKLTRMVDLGGRDAKIREAPAFERLRSRPDFQRLAADLAFPIDPFR